MDNGSRHGIAVKLLGLHVAVTERISTVPGPRFASMVVTEAGRQVAFFRCEESGDFAGWGWVEHANGAGRRDFGSWPEFLTALSRHPAAVRRAS